MLRNFISKVRSSRLCMADVWVRIEVQVVICLLLCAPLVFFAQHFANKYQMLSKGHDQLKMLIKGAEKNALLRKKQSIQLQQLALADADYIEKHLVEFSPMQTQVEDLTTLMANEALAGCREWQSRLGEIASEENHLHFSKEMQKAVKNIEEVVLKQDHPVQLSSSDVQQVLAFVEGVKVGLYAPAQGRPDLMFKTFRMRRKEVSPSNQAFLVDMELIKREGVRK